MRWFFDITSKMVDEKNPQRNKTKSEFEWFTVVAFAIIKLGDFSKTGSHSNFYSHTFSAIFYFTPSLYLSIAKLHTAQSSFMNLLIV